MADVPNIGTQVPVLGTFSRLKKSYRAWGHVNSFISANILPIEVSGHADYFETSTGKNQNFDGI